MNTRFISWIWHIKGSVPLPAEQSRDEVFSRLDPLFHQPGTSHRWTNDTLTFHKKDQAAQDKMSVFDSGVLNIDNGSAGPVLQYHLVSRALLFCFLLPLLFVGFAQLTVALGNMEKTSSEAAAKPTDTSKKPQKAQVPQNAIDKFLGSPAPEKPKKDDTERDEKPSPTPAYVFAVIFAVLYVVGRVLEDRLVKSLFKKSLQSGRAVHRAGSGLSAAR